MSQMNPKEVFHNTAYSVQLPYIAGHSPLKEIPEHFPFQCTQHPVHNTAVVVDFLTFSAHLPVSVFFLENRVDNKVLDFNNDMKLMVN